MRFIRNLAYHSVTAVVLSLEYLQDSFGRISPYIHTNIHSYKETVELSQVEEAEALLYFLFKLFFNVLNKIE